MTYNFNIMTLVVLTLPYIVYGDLLSEPSWSDEEKDIPYMWETLTAKLLWVMTTGSFLARKYMKDNNIVYEEEDSDSDNE